MRKIVTLRCQRGNYGGSLKEKLPFIVFEVKVFQCFEIYGKGNVTVQGRCCG